MYIYILYIYIIYIIYYILYTIYICIGQIRIDPKMGVSENGAHQHPVVVHHFHRTNCITVEVLTGAHWTLGCGQHQVATWFPVLRETRYGAPNSRFAFM